MTDLNKYNPYPESFTITCPRCGGPAEFRFAFTIVGRHGPPPPPAWPGAAVTTWGKWSVVQHDPALYPWKAPPRGFARSDDGIRACLRCGGRFAHTLSWPSDAYFHCEVRGKTLWAWSAEQVVVLRDFLASSDRDPARYPGHSLFLRHIPPHFTSAKNREAAVAQLEKLLAKQRA